MSLSDFDTVLNKLPQGDILANINYNLEKLEKAEAIKSYKEFVVNSYYNGEIRDALFYDPLYPVLSDIHKRISYTKYKRVVRHGTKCKRCGSENTTEEERRRGGGDEYIPTRVECHDCGKKFQI